MPNQGDINPNNSNYVWGSNNRWVLQSTTGSGGQNAGVTTTPTTPTTPTTTPTSQPPTGATYISNPAQLSSLTESQIWRDPNSDRIYQLPSGGGLDVQPAESEIDITQTQDSRIEGGTGNTALDQFIRNTQNSGQSQAERAMQDLLARMEAERGRNEQEAQARQDAAAAGLEDIQQGESFEDIRRRLNQEFELEETRKQLAEYQNQLVALSEEGTMADIAIRNKPIHAAIIRGQRAIKQEEVAAKAATIQAKVAIVGEQFDLASQTVDSLFNAAAQDRQDSIRYYERLFDLERQNLITLNAEERENITAQMNLIQNADERARDNQEKIASLFADPVMAKAFQQSGANLTDDFATTMQKMLPFITDENTRLEALRTSGSGSGTITASTSDFNSRIRDIASQLKLSETAGDLTDLEYSSIVSGLVDEMYDTTAEGFDFAKSYSEISSLVNTAMEGKPLSEAFGFRPEDNPPEVTDSFESNPETILQSWFPSNTNTFTGTTALSPSGEGTNRIRL